MTEHEHAPELLPGEIVVFDAHPEFDNADGIFLVGPRPTRYVFMRYVGTFDGAAVLETCEQYRFIVSADRVRSASTPLTEPTVTEGGTS